MASLSASPKAMLKRMLSRFGFYLGRYPQTNTLDSHLLYLFSSLMINCVLDVGACHGDYGTELRRLGYRGHIISFEPVAQNFEVLSRRCAGDAAWRAYPWALGDQDGHADINVLSGNTFGSFLSPSKYGLDRFASKMRLERTERVQVKRLETVFDECVAEIDQPRVFLKMDTQGYDLAVVEGAGKKLEEIIALQTELSVKPIYEGMSTTFLEAIASLRGRGFELTGLFPMNWDPNDRLRIIEMDCVMCRPSRGIESPEESSHRA